MDEKYIEHSNKLMRRREFLKLCGLISATLALPKELAPQIARAMASATRPPVVWLEFQDCTGDTESLLRATPCADLVQAGVTDPDIVDLLLSSISLNYHETVMAPAGSQAEKSLSDTLNAFSGKYIAVVEGSIPMANNGVYCAIHGKTALSIAQQVLPNAFATIAVGSCAFDGGLAAAAPNLTGAVGVKEAVPGLNNLINMPGCPINVVNLVSAIVYVLTFNKLPPLDSLSRPTFAYGASPVHALCERQGHYNAGEYVRAWGDEGHKNGWCLYLMGCKGPATHSNCPVAKWNNGTNWCVAAGHGCIGCTEPGYWDKYPLYQLGPGA